MQLGIWNLSLALENRASYLVLFCINQLYTACNQFKTPFTDRFILGLSNKVDLIEGQLFSSHNIYFDENSLMVIRFHIRVMVTELS